MIVPLIFAAVALHAGQAFAQGAVTAPPPGQAIAPARDASPVPFPSNGTAPIDSTLQRGPAPPPGGASDACMKGFAPLREEAEERGKLIKAAGERHAPPEEACRLIGNFGQSEIKMIKYIEANSAKCGISPQIADQLKAGHNNT